MPKLSEAGALAAMVCDLRMHRECARVIEQELPAKFRRWRRKVKMKQNDLAKYCGVSPQYLADVEMGKRAIPDRILAGMATAIGELEDV